MRPASLGHGEEGPLWLGTRHGDRHSHKISLAIPGGVKASMLVSYTKWSQNVNIAVQGVALQGVRIALGRSGPAIIFPGIESALALARDEVSMA